MIYKISFLAIFLPTFLFAQRTPPKREFRAVWIANVVNIDFPSKKTLTVPQQKAEFIKLLDKCEEIGLNAVIVQIRPAADALYKSEIEPWSEWLTGAQGKAPEDPDFDPLAFMVEESHKRNLEFHAWFNPFRAVFHSQKSSIAPNHISKQHPEWIVAYGKGKLLNPGIPEVRQYVTNVISDVVQRYEIDAVHFDDYFYPYPVKGQVFNDSVAYAQYGKAFKELADWRRNNIDLFVQNTYEAIQESKPYVKFGISPFGVWRNIADDPTGSDTKAGAPTYDVLYADVLKWLKEGWIDYVLPQIYWSMDFKPAAYSKLLPWWAKNSFDRHVYIGHGAYRINSGSDSAWYQPSEIPTQLRMLRDYSSQVQGSCYFSMKSLLKNANGVTDSLSQHFYQYPALLPTTYWKDAVPPQAPKKVKLKQKKTGTLVKWKKPRKASDQEKPSKYVVYRFSSNEKVNLEDPSKIIGFHTPKTKKWLDQNASKNQYKYVVTALDRQNNESTGRENK